MLRINIYFKRKIMAKGILFTGLPTSGTVSTQNLTIKSLKATAVTPMGGGNPIVTVDISFTIDNATASITDAPTDIPNLSRGKVWLPFNSDATGTFKIATPQLQFTQQNGANVNLIIVHTDGKVGGSAQAVRQS